MSGFGQKVMTIWQTYVTFPYDPFEYRLSFYVRSFFAFYNLECFNVAAEGDQDQGAEEDTLALRRKGNKRLEKPCVCVCVCVFVCEIPVVSVPIHNNKTVYKQPKQVAI